MSESAREPGELQPPQPQPVATARLEIVRQIATVLLAITALVWLVRLMISRNAIEGAWGMQVMLATSAIMAASWGSIQRHRMWTLPAKRLLQLLPEVHRGEAHIEELSQITGGVRPLIPLIQDMLRELRAQRGAIAELELEMRQRVASRTDALERTIGSLRQQATRDALTGLFNRRFLDQYLAQCIQRHLKERKDLCLLMIDVDHFKLLNDTLGHAAGDDLLKAIGQLIRSAIRGEDVGFRHGGDEFVILLPSSGLDAGKVLADRLSSLVDLLGKTLKVARPPGLSIGLATLNACTQHTPEALLSAADRALYDTKKARRASRDGALNTSGGGVQSSPLSRKAG